MADGPDPNRYVPPDPETAAGDDEGLGDLPSTRFWLPPWAIGAIALLICLFVLSLALRGVGGQG